MSLDKFTPSVLTGVVTDLPPKDTGLLGLAFPRVVTHPTADISTDYVDDMPEIAPVISPIEKGVVLKDQSFTQKTITPAFSRVKKRVDFTKAISRIPGQKLDDIEDNTTYHMTNGVVYGKKSIVQRQKFMAAQALYEGRITYSDKDGRSFEVDFGRHADLNLTLTGTKAWTDKTAPVFEQLEAGATKVADVCGSVSKTLVLTPFSWNLFRATDDVTKALESRRGSNSQLETACGSNKGLEYKGTIGDFDVIVYSEKGKDSKGNTFPMLDDKAAILLNIEDVMGALHHGALKNGDKVEAMDYLAKRLPVDDETEETWVKVDSSYLPIPHRIDATYALTVA
ncbi:MAG TPA: hypothetical protein DCL21_07120 [Alphaproteobacteria bacterium]|nr:hypothetical protein [Alphaproteobacteria bacterium]